MSEIVAGCTPIGLGGYLPANTVLVISVIITLIALFIFEFVRGRFAGVNQFKSAIQTLLVGGIAAAAAFAVRIQK
ncbi:VIT1/CCC1 transporter family protein [Ferroacidibacillus organovorans]|uniref:Uncharacterized protein n=1 Tax=Ferroacidibacillus organovorans TaxID=1765683 RepID=A0A853KFR4_9BACL|nr:VIT1/CCC1 transporter family protein [Ferroacidibacillus organovorans]KYP81322.1 hypothetical protein AYJ22_00720 [Ferroacidibacillus organovorans]OAG95109.1 hypothetical protein AYW79_01320 [Ferroacidibacillus organovorans]